MAWTLGKPLIAYSDDVRSLIAGRINPLLVGMVDFTTVDERTSIPEALSKAILHQPLLPMSHDNLSPKMQSAVFDGEKLWHVMLEQHAQFDDERMTNAVTALFAPAEDIPVGEDH